MNGEESFLFIWIKTLSKEYNLITNVHNFNYFLLDYCIDDGFIYDFFKIHFDKKFYDHLDNECNKIHFIQQNLIKYLEFFNFTPKMTKELFNKKMYLKENKIKLWKIFFTVSYLEEFCYDKFFVFDNRMLDESVLSLATVYNITNTTKKNLKLEFLTKSPILMRSTVQIVTEVLNEIEDTYYDYQTTIGRIFSENVQHEALLDCTHVYSSHSPNQSVSSSPFKERHRKQTEIAVSPNVSVIDLENFQTFGHGSCKQCEELQKYQIELEVQIEEMKETNEKINKDIVEKDELFKHLHDEVGQLRNKIKGVAKFDHILKRSESRYSLQLEENDKLKEKLLEKDEIIFKQNEREDDKQKIEDLTELLEEYKIKYKKLTENNNSPVKERISIHNLNIYNTFPQQEETNPTKIIIEKEKEKFHTIIFSLSCLLFLLILIVLSK